MKKKMLSLALVAMFALGAAACGGGDTTDGATTGTGGGATTAPTEATS